MKRVLKTIMTWFTPNRGSAPEPIVKQSTKPIKIADLCDRIKVTALCEEDKEDTKSDYRIWMEHYQVMEELTRAATLDHPHKLS